jgi:CMP-N,N'-diacetyllegionaminic acid synthase
MLINNKKILAIIPARKNSKRVSGKNIKPLNGTPLIEWTIETALRSNLEHIVVSTDCEEIAKIAVGCGAEVPFLRASKLAQDDSIVIDTVIEMMEYFAKYNDNFDAVMLLQPTSPFRSVETIQNAIGLFNSCGGESVVSVSPANPHPHWCKTIQNGVLKPYTPETKYKVNLNAQELPDIYQLNGLIYLASVDTILTNRSFYSENTRALIISSDEEAIDIDTPLDWAIAEAVANKIGVKP